jgi:16S rRNA (adenine1518-N6/adenine1519-N6)-dimethyltransferase
MEYTLKKSLGQHFLKDDSVCVRIREALQLVPFTQLLEVGPGGGALTRHLLTWPGVDFKAVELDKEKVAYLEKKYPAIQGKLIEGDILQIRPPFSGSFHLVGNFPYNISSQILFRMLEWKEQVPLVVGMFQKEVAERVVSGPGSRVYGILSILVQAFYETEYLFDVPPESFNPPPKVMSGVIRLVKRSAPVPMQSEKKLQVLVKAAFNQRRKKLRNAVRGLFTPEFLQDALFDKRAEQLGVEEFCQLSFKML